MEIESIFPLNYRLSDPNYTIYHRAALGGLAATIKAWGKSPPEGIFPKLDHDFVTIEKIGDLTEREALKLILDASFKLTEDKLIDLPGQFIPIDKDDLRLVIHNALYLTFLQKGKDARSAGIDSRLMIQSADDEASHCLSYKAISWYAHQTAKGTDVITTNSTQIANLPQWVIPSAMAGIRKLQAAPKEAFLLLFLIVACQFFILKPNRYKDKKSKEKLQACIIIPDVIDLLGFSRAIERISAQSRDVVSLTNSYLNRVVGGAEEAALAFLVDSKENDLVREKSIAGCESLAMGFVSWDTNKKQRYKTRSFKLRGEYTEMPIFRTAKKYLSQRKLLQDKDGNSYPSRSNPFTEVIAANLVSDNHWCNNLSKLVAKKDDFQYFLSKRKGLNEMAKAIKNKEDIAIIRAFHKAWEITRGQMGKRARDNNLDFYRLVEVRQEKIRNELLRLKTSETAANWFLKFCAYATKGDSLAPFLEDAELIRDFIFNRRNFERLQNLLLFALVSYESDKNKEINKNGEN